MKLSLLFALPLLLGATGQRTGTPSPTSDVSQNRVTSTGSTTARALRDRWADVVNVKDFGAKGDGVTDDTAAIRSALAAGGHVFLPPGTYMTTGTIALNNRVGVTFSVRGAGRALTKIQASGAIKMFQVNDGTVTAVEHHGWTIADLTIDGATTGTIGIEFGQTSVSPKSAGGTVERVTVTRCATAGVKLTSAQLLAFRDVWLDANAGDGVWSVAGSVGNENDHVSFAGDCRFRTNKRGAYLEQFDRFTFDGCDFETNTEEAIYVNKADNVAHLTQNLVMRDCWIEVNNTSRDPSTNPKQVRFVAAGTQTIQNVLIRDSRFNGRGAANGERHIYFTRGSYEITDNWYSQPQTQCLESLDSSLVFIHGRSNRYQKGANEFFQFVPLTAYPNIFWEQDGAENSSAAYPFSKSFWVNGGNAAMVEILRLTGGDGNLAAGQRVPKLAITGKVIAYGTAAPTGGTWAIGDRVYNSAPSIGQPKSWVCTVAGTPGTWVSEGNL